LKCAAENGIERIQVMGDSKLLVDWANGGSHIENPVLSTVMNRVSEVRMKLLEISFSRIYRQFNEKMNRLSKEALSLQERTLTNQ
jgi:hypothetical protein